LRSMDGRSGYCGSMAPFWSTASSCASTP
jgi:hypothetical protein